MRISLRAVTLALACVGIVLALADVALASDCHRDCNGGYLGATALVGGALALGSSALGTRLGGTATPKRVTGSDLASAERDAGPPVAAQSRIEDAALRTDLPPVPPSEPVAAVPSDTSAAPRSSVDPREAMAASAAPAQAPAAAVGTAAGGSVDAQKVFKAGTEYAGKLAKEMAPHGGAVDSGLGIVHRVATSEDRIAGLAEGLSEVAIDQTRDVVKDATKIAPAPTTPSPSVGTTPRYCRSCGTATREGAKFCASCGTRL